MTRYQVPREETSIYLTNISEQVFSMEMHTPWCAPYIRTAVCVIRISHFCNVFKLMDVSSANAQWSAISFTCFFQCDLYSWYPLCILVVAKSGKLGKLCSCQEQPFVNRVCMKLECIMKVPFCIKNVCNFPVYQDIPLSLFLGQGGFCITSFHSSHKWISYFVDCLQHFILHQILNHLVHTNLQNKLPHQLFVVNREHWQAWHLYS